MFARIDPHDTFTAVGLSIASAHRVEFHRTDCITSTDRTPTAIQLTHLAERTLKAIAGIYMKQRSTYE